MPEFGLDRELDWLKNMHDWLISKKNRYWGLALPIYECKKCGQFEVIGSKEELEKRAVAGWREFDGQSPHKPYIDKVKIKCLKCGEPVSRIDDVGNPWLDAGIVPYSTISEDNQGEPLYTKNNKEWRNWFPVNFITESFPGQFKNWFYAMIAESTVLENEPPFERVLGYGTLLGEDGRPMHKSWGNAIEFNEGADKIGVDVMRWMFARQNPADNMLFGYHKADQVRRQFYLMLWNVYKFFIEYVNLDRASLPNFSDSVGTFPLWGNPKSQRNWQTHLPILDRWIFSRLSSLILFVEESLKKYNARDAAVEVEKFVSDLSTWFIRRSRDRVWVNSDDEDDKKKFYSTLYGVLVNLSIVISPFMPFVSEEVYTNLTGNESVHLESWPEIDSKSKAVDKKLEEEMILARSICEAGHGKRKELGVKVRVPLAKLGVAVDGDASKIKEAVWSLVLKELNVKNIVVNKVVRFPIKEVKVTPEELKYEGELRDFLRTSQAMRKEQGLRPTDYIDLEIPEKFRKDEAQIKKRLMVKVK